MRNGGARQTRVLHTYTHTSKSNINRVNKGKSRGAKMGKLPSERMNVDGVFSKRVGMFRLEMVPGICVVILRLFPFSENGILKMDRGVTAAI